MPLRLNPWLDSDDEEKRGSDDNDEDDSDRSRNYNSSDNETDRGSDGEEETDYDEDYPNSPPGSPPISSRRRKRRCIIDENLSDRISELPDVLIINILNRLPIRHAIRTGVLSKRWSYLWTSVDTISINRPYHSSLSWRSVFKGEKRKQKFITFVDKTLVLCTHSNVKKFALEFCYERRFVSNVNLWVRFAMQKQVEEFDLNLYHYRPGHRYKIPKYVFDNSRLVKLSLSKCKIIPRGTVGWKSLKSLTIKHSEISAGLIKRILKGSPVLEVIELYRFYTNMWSDVCFSFKSLSLKTLVIRGYRDPRFDPPSTFLRISAPGIVSLEITGDLGRQKLRLVNVSSVVDAKLDFSVDKESADVKDELKAKKLMMRNLFGRLMHAKNLTLGSWFTQVASLNIKGKPSPLYEWKSLKLLVHMEQCHLPGIACLLRSSPALETLVIDMEYKVFNKAKLCETIKFDEKSYWTNLRFGCPFTHLKTVKIFGFTGESFVLQLGFVQFLLENAPELEKLVISNAKKEGCTPEEFAQVIQKVSSFPRSSHNVVISFPQSPQVI